MRSPELVDPLADSTDERLAAAEPLVEAARAERVLSGRVLDAELQPLAGARILAAATAGMENLPLESLDPAVHEWSSRVETTTDQTGRFRLVAPARGMLRLGVRAEGHAPLDRAIGAVETALGDLVLTADVELAGQVVDAFGNAVAGAVLRWVDPEADAPMLADGSRGVPVARTDQAGAFHANGLPSGAWALLITSADHPDTIVRGEGAAPGERVDGLRITLLEGAEIRGRVTGAEPEQLARLWICAAPRGQAQGMAEVRRTKCAIDGTFVLRGTRPDTEYELYGHFLDTEAMRPLSDPRTKRARARGGDPDVELAYEPDTAILFRVLDARTLQPLSRFEVHAGFSFAAPLLDRDGRTRRTFEGGEVRFGGLVRRSPDDTVEVRVTAPGYLPLHVSGLHVEPGTEWNLGDVFLTPDPNAPRADPGREES